MFKSIKGRFIGFSVIFIIICTGIPSFFLIKQFEKNFEQRSHHYLETSLDLLLFGLEDAMMYKDKKVQNVVEKIAKNENVDHIRIFDENGKIIQSSVPLEIGKNILAIAPHHLDSNFVNFKKRKTSIAADKHAFVGFQPILNKKECQDCHTKEVIAYLDIDTHLTLAEKYFYTGILHLFILSVVIIILLIISFYFIYNAFINKPMNKFIEALSEVEKGNLEIRLPENLKNEYGTVNKHFNNMISEIKHSREKIEEMHFDQIRRADKLVTIGEIATQISHEINNYSAIILSRSDFLLLEGQNNDQLAPYFSDLQVIQNYVTKITGITKNILRHSKKVTMEFSEFGLDEVINQNLKFLKPLIEKRGINISFEKICTDCKIYGNQDQIEQVLTNLITNSMDALAEGNGEIKISLSDFDKQIKLIIEDNGKGISLKDQNFIFDPFFTTKKSGKGTGLGLYIVRNILEAHGAKIYCESKIGKFTKFNIVFNRQENLNEEENSSS